MTDYAGGTTGLTAVDALALLLFACIQGSTWYFSGIVKGVFPIFFAVAARQIIGSIGLVAIAPVAACFEEEPEANEDADPADTNTTIALVGILNTVVPNCLLPYCIELGVVPGMIEIFKGLMPFIAAGIMMSSLPTHRQQGFVTFTNVGLVVGFCGVASLILNKASTFDHDVASVHTYKAHTSNALVSDVITIETHSTGNVYSVLSQGIGYALALVAVSSKAAACVTAERSLFSVGVGGTPHSVALQSTLVGAGTAVVLTLLFDATGLTGAKYGDFMSSASSDVWWSIIFLGLFASAAKYALQFFLIHRIGAVRQKSVDFLAPVFLFFEVGIFTSDYHEWGAVQGIATAVGLLNVIVSMYLIHWGGSAVAGNDANSLMGEKKPLVAAAYDQPETGALVDTSVEGADVAWTAGGSDSLYGSAYGSAPTQTGSAFGGPGPTQTGSAFGGPGPETDGAAWPAGGSDSPYGSAHGSAPTQTGSSGVRSSLQKKLAQRSS